MKIALLVLSGDPEIARSRLAEKFPAAEFADLTRGALERGGSLSRVFNLRKMGVDVFAVMTECLEWQYGQEALMLFGALGGANESVIIDARGGWRHQRRGSLLVKGPITVANLFRRGRAALTSAVKCLEQIELEVAQPRTINLGPVAREPVKIAYLRATPAAGTQPGGATSHINGVINGLISLGAAIDVISNDEIAGLNKNKVDFRLISPDPRVMPRPAFDLHNGMLFSRTATQMIAAGRPDVIYQRYCRFSWAGVEASLRAGVPLFLEYNGSEVWIGKNWDRTGKLDLLERCERLNLEAATRIFVISEVEKNNLLAAGVDGDKIIVNPNGVDTDEFRPGIGGLKERERLGVSEETVLVGFVGSFGPWHGVLTLADAIALTSGKMNIHFLFIGDGSLRGEVESKLSSSENLNRASFTGVVRHDRVPPMLDACDILVSPHVPLANDTKFFGSPTKLFEYMAMGKGIVASDLAQIGDVLTDEETALLVEPGNALELSEGISRLAENAEFRRRLGRAARQEAVEKHTWRQNAARVLEAFRR